MIYIIKEKLYFSFYFYLIITEYEKYINMLYWVYIDSFRNKDVFAALRKKFTKS